MARQILNAPVESQSGGIVKITRYKNASLNREIGTAGDGRAALINTTFTKDKSDAETYIVVTGIIPTDGMPNYPQIGMTLTIDDIALQYNTSYTGHNGVTRNGAGGGGIYYCGPDIENEGTLHIVHKSFKEFNLGVGNHTLKGGWYSNSSVRSCRHVNPDSTLQNAYGGADRHQRCGTHICIYEIART